MNRTLDAWLDYQQRTHPRDIDLGLDRVRTVWHALGAPRPAPVVLTVGGTNGKGSTVAMLEAMLRAAGYRTGCYTSPHILRYNERVRIDGHDAPDAAFVEAFERIERARGDTAQTYFEFGTLAAILIMARAQVDVAILEVGLGGRLDAVNIIDADVSVVTTVDLDHQDWLGPDVDTIGREKAGIARQGRPAVVGDPLAPQGLLQALSALGALTEQAGTHFGWRTDEGPGGQWWHTDGTVLPLPPLALEAPVQQANAATAVAALHAVRERIPVPPEAIQQGLAATRVPGRLQVLATHPLTVVDVAHNPQAARALADWLAGHHAGRVVHAVYGALADKDVAAVVTTLAPHVGRWYLGGLERDTPRGLNAQVLHGLVRQACVGAEANAYTSVVDALHAARKAAGADDIVLVFGSFFVVSAALAAVA